MAKKHPTSSRVQRDDGLPDDAFVGTIKRLMAWGQENQRQVTIGGIAVLVVAAAAWWFFAQQAQLEATAASRYTQVQQTMASGNVQLAIRDLQAFLNRFGGTDVADQARLQLAEALIQQDRPQEAVDALGDLPEDIDHPFGIAAARLQASAYEAMDSLDQAVDRYADIARNARFPYQRRAALEDAARVQLQNGQPAEAVELLQRLVDTFEEGESGRGYYEMWLAEARAQAAAG